MRFVPQAILDSLLGSVNPKLTFHAWYNNQLTQANLPVSTWALTWQGDAGTQIQGSLSCTVTDPTGKLAPWGYDEPLAPAGQQIQCVYSLGNDLVPLGLYALDDTTPTEYWRLLAGGTTRATWISGGASVPLQAKDLTLLADEAKFMAPESPVGTSAIAEIKRLLDGIIGVQVGSVTDATIPSTLTYSKDRLGAVYDLVALIGACRMTGDGQLELFSPAQTEPVWHVKGGDEGALVQVGRTLRRGDLFNAVVSTSTQADKEIVGYAYLREGPIRFDGPLGRKPLFHNALATTQEGVDLDALQTLEANTRQRRQTLKVWCLPHPGVQVGDWVRVAQPTVAGKTYPLDGIVTRVSLSGDTAGMKEMELDVSCRLADIQAVARWIRKFQ